MLTNQEIWTIALQQSAYDSGCLPVDFLKAENVVTISQKHPQARKYLKLPLSCDLVSYGTNIVAQASEEKTKGCTEFASDCELSNVQSVQFHLNVGFEEANRIICFTKKL